MVPGVGVEPRRAGGPSDFKATGRGQRTKDSANSLPFPVSEESEEGRGVRGLWTPRWTPVLESHLHPRQVQGAKWLRSARVANPRVRSLAVASRVRATGSIAPSNVVSEAAPGRMEGPPATPETGMVAVPRGRLLYRHVVVERVGRVAGVVVVVADQRECVTVTRHDAGVDLCPGAGPDADLR